MKRIVQFQITPAGKIIALDEDGHLWVKENEWFRIKALPEKYKEDSDQYKIEHNGTLTL